MRITYSLPLDEYQRKLADRVLRESGAPFDLTDPAAFRDRVARVWGLYQAVRHKEHPFLPPLRIADRVDQLIYERKRQEYIDDPAIPIARRERLVRNLARLNEVLFSYHWFFAALEDVVRRIPGDEVSILDIGSGHGEFPIALAKKGTLGGKRLRVVGSDIDPDYVRQAQERARAEGVAVEFRVVDALQLDRLEERFDVITSTQTVHHFSPAFVAELIARARLNARHEVVLFDARRSALSLAGVTIGTLAVARDPMFLHDGVYSVRRMYSPAEFEMLARCAPGGAGARARNLAYGFVVLEAAAQLTIYD